MVNALAVTTAKRSSALPDLPTIAESGVPGYDSGVWYGLLAPAGTPSQIITWLHNEAIRVLNSSDLRGRITTEAVEPIGSTPEYFAGYIKSELAKWAKVVKESGARID